MSHDPLPDANDHETPWHLTLEDVQEFKRLIKEATGDELTDQEAWNRATELVALYRMLLGPSQKTRRQITRPAPGSHQSLGVTRNLP